MPTGDNALRKCKVKTNFAACGQNLGEYAAKSPYYKRFYWSFYRAV